jgi:hypothetical protein
MQRDLQFLLDMLQSAELIMTYTVRSSNQEQATKAYELWRWLLEDEYEPVEGRLSASNL